MSTRYSRRAVNSVSTLETTCLYMMIVATTSHSSVFLPRMVVSVKKREMIVNEVIWLIAT